MRTLGVKLNGFEGRVAVVTGAARGIGRRIAEELVAQGARTALFDVLEPRDGDNLVQHPDACLVSCDVTDDTAVDRAFTTVEERWGTVSILVNNSGIIELAPIEDTDPGVWRRVLEVNLTGAFLCAKRALPGMRAQGYGRVVSIGSSAGKTGGARAAGAYAASKAGVMSLAKTIASEYARDGITSNALAPTLINTDMITGLADLADRIPVGRLGEPEDVAFAVLFLASADASFITGEVTDVNGGFLID